MLLQLLCWHCAECEKKLYCCLLPQSEALHTCRSVLEIAMDCSRHDGWNHPIRVHL